MRRPLFWAALCLVTAAALRLWAGDNPDPPQGQDLKAYEEIALCGQVYKKDGSELYLQDVSVCRLFSEVDSSDQVLLSQAGESRQMIPCQENFICETQEELSIPLGSRVALKGRFLPFSRASNPGEFDAFLYYRTLGVGGRLDRAVVLGADGNAWPFREALYDLRMFLHRRLYLALGEREAGVMCALLLGEKDGLEEQVEKLYQRSGILHILSISSLHVTILGMSLYRLLRRMGVPVAPAAAAGSILLLLYGGLTGFGVSAVRAIGMYLIRMLGEAAGRTYDMLTALGVMAAVMTAANPFYLQHGGFLLSYSSVLGIVLLSPALSPGDAGAAGQREKERRDKKEAAGAAKQFKRAAESIRAGLGQSARTSVSVTLATLPVQLWCYYEIPVYGTVLNLFVLPFVKLLMLSGILLAAFPGFFPAAVAARGILWWYESLCGLFARLPFHTWNPGRPAPWQIAVYYGILAVLAVFAGQVKKRDKQRERTRRILLGRMIPAAILAAAVFVLGYRRLENRVTFLDVGQGDGILVQTSSGENYLFDCGSSSRSSVGKYVLLPCLKYYGIRRLDGIFASHPDSDHVNGILELLEMGEDSGIEVCQLVLPKLAGENREELLGELMEAAGSGGTALRYIAAGDAWECGSARFTCLHPAADLRWEEPNALSQCFYVEFFGDGSGKGRKAALTLLLTGDVEGAGEEALLEEMEQRGIGGVDVLKVAHHGSSGATSRAFLEQADPGTAVISCGRNNRYGHPHQELLDRLEDAGSRILQTREQGAVILLVR